MLDGIQQWLHQNAPWLDPLGSLVVVLTGILAMIAFLFFKRIRLTNRTYHFAAEFAEVGG